MIEVRDLSHEFGRRATRLPVLAVRALVARKGTLTLVCGASGAGKTTLLHIVAGLLRPLAGSVLVEGVSLYGLSEAARDRHRASHIGYLMQEPAWLDSLTAEENVMLPMLFAGARRAVMRSRASDLLARFGLEQRLRHAPSALSTGERIRVALARALSVDPAVVLADEPTASLDADAARHTASLLSSLAHEHGKTVLVATHHRELFEADDEIQLGPEGRAL
jgi:ABC-type lipoprotein export system ATPase subunit